MYTDTEYPYKHRIWIIVQLAPFFTTFFTYSFHNKPNCDRKAESKNVHCEKSLSQDFKIVIVVRVCLILKHVMDSAQAKNYCGMNPKRSIALAK